MHHTVHDAFGASARRTPGAEFLFTESVTARAYDIAPGAILWGDAAAQVERLRAAYARPATATATASGCCWRTGRPFSSIGSRSMHWA